MPSNATAKIKSARKLLIILGFALAVLGGVLWWALAGSEAERVLRAGGQTYRLEVAAAPSQRQQGLSGRRALAPDAGMLFAYEQPRELCFWMKDMRFPLDIIWLDAQRRVVHLEERVAPGTYPRTFCAANAQYVIELNAGQAARADIAKGEVLDF